MSTMMQRKPQSWSWEEKQAQDGYGQFGEDANAGCDTARDVVEVVVTVVKHVWWSDCDTDMVLICWELREKSAQW